MASIPVRIAMARVQRLNGWLGARPWIFLILLASGLLLLRNLGHRGLTYWDESFHAIVARNLTKHPLKFTLYDQPWLAYDYTDWGGNHIWLHKPPVAMWQICIAYYMLGVNAFALRLPSAIMGTIAVWLTYRIATDLFGRRAGAIAAFLQGFNPFLFASIHGYRYSDHIDITLLFWVEVSCWFLLRAIRTGKGRLYALSGVAQGLAYLSKSYLALITFGVACVVWLFARLKPRVVHLLSLMRVYLDFRSLKDLGSLSKPSTDFRSEPLDLEGGRIRLRDLGLQLLTSILTVAPWATYCLIRYPREYIYEHRRVLDHLDTDVESWAATWDRPLFDYMVLFYPVFYVAVLAAVLCLIWAMFKRRKLGEPFILAWAIGVVVPHSYALTKTPSATMLAVPPLLIGLAVIISRSWERKDWAYTAIWLASMLAITLVKGGQSLVTGRDQFDSMNKFVPYIETNFWIIQQLIAFVFITTLLAGGYALIRRFVWQKWLWWGFRIVALAISLFYAKGYISSAVAVTHQNVDDPLYTAIGERIQRELPKNACLFLDDPMVGTHFYLMYYADRSTYVIKNEYMPEPRNVPEDARRVREAGGIPYLVAVTGVVYEYPVVIEGEAVLGNGQVKTYRVYKVVENQGADK